MFFITKQCKNIDTNALAENVLELKQKYVSVKMIADMEEYEDFENTADTADSKRIGFYFDEKNVKKLAWIIAAGLMLLLALICSGYGRKEETIIVVRVQNPPNFFRSGGAVLAKISGAVPSKKFGAERSGGAEILKNFDFFGVYHEFFANYCSRGTKTLTYYS